MENRRSVNAEIKTIIERARGHMKSAMVLLDTVETDVGDARFFLGKAWALAHEAVKMAEETRTSESKTAERLLGHLEDGAKRLEETSAERGKIAASAVDLHRILRLAGDLRISTTGSKWERRRHVASRIVTRAAVGTLLAGTIAAGVFTWVSTPKIDEGLLGTYYAEQGFKGFSIKRLDHEIDFRWGLSTPMPGIRRDHFSVRWEGCISIDEGGETRIVAGADDGIRVFIDGVKIIDDWSAHEFRTVTSKGVAEGGIHTIKVEYSEVRGIARAYLGMRESTGPDSPVLSSRLIPPGGNDSNDCPAK